MSEYLAIDFDPHRLAGIRARVNNQRVRVEQCFELQWPSEIDHWADPAAAGGWLKGELARLGVSADEVLVSLPRDEVVVRQLDVPDVPDEALPSLVRLQAETKSASSLGDLVLDFLPLPRSSQSTARQVLMITIARDRLDRLAQLTSAAGFQLSAVGISTVATSELVARAEARLGAERDDAALVVSQTRRRVEISLVRDGHLLFTHSARLGGADSAADNAATLAEVRRSLGALSRIDAELRVSRAWVVGADTETAALRGVMEEHLDCAVSALQPLADTAITCRAIERPQVQAQLAGPIGMLLGAANPTVAMVDLLRPRQPLVRPDRRRLMLGLAVCGVAASIALGFGNMVWQTRAIDAQIRDAQEQLTRASEVIERAESTLVTAGLIGEWDNRDIDFIFQMTELNRVLPGTDRVYLQNLRFTPLTGEAIAQIQADGRARTREEVQQLYQRLAAHSYRVKTHEIVSNEDDKEYPVEFMLDLGITAATNTHVEVPSPTAGVGGGDDEAPTSTKSTETTESTESTAADAVAPVAAGDVGAAATADAADGADDATAAKAGDQ